MGANKEQRTWYSLSHGSFNRTYVSSDDGDDALVFKEVHYDEFNTDTPERSVYLWNIMNPDLNPKAQIATVTLSDGEDVTGWTCPLVTSKYLKRTPSTDQSYEHYKPGEIFARDIKQSVENGLKSPTITEDDALMSAALVDIFQRTGRLITDAANPGNFVITEDGRAICIDVGLALKIEQAEEDHYAERYTGRYHSVSGAAWTNLRAEITANWKEEKSPYPQTVLMSKALCFIKTNRPDIRNLEFLKSNDENTKILAAAYDGDAEAGITLLDQEHPLTLKSMKESCELVLRDYINSRGFIDEGQTFTTSKVTNVFRQKLLTEKKVAAALELITKIQGAGSKEEITEYINDMKSKDDLTQGTFTKGYEASLGQCLAISDLPLPPPSMEARPYS
ncbi:MAG: hypothetical protein NXI01_06425 [Gammaproteobacteria bacterium]|nr:hypothetical protein [Gammaproteobacteria bacterium]